MALNEFTLNYPVDIRRRIDRAWRRRFASAPARVRHHGRCPLCHAPAPAAPAASVWQAGLVHHHWLCKACGEVWTSTVRAAGARS
jgi:hypothetical protein